MRRREFVALLGSAAAWPITAGAQTHGERVVRLGLLRATTSQQRDFEAFVEGLRGLGYLPGKNINIEPRHADGVLSRLPELASELVSWGPDIIVVDGNPQPRRCAPRPPQTRYRSYSWSWPTRCGWASRQASHDRAE